jgi:hypothetical protein
VGAYSTENRVVLFNNEGNGGWSASVLGTVPGASAVFAADLNGEPSTTSSSHRHRACLCVWSLFVKPVSPLASARRCASSSRLCTKATAGST